ncbi:MAG: hypothetical protein EOP11_17180 [Proteobacteria bacterium]|nr:MAG: hypothetical protein EOP11_17180 [Pseudomonadota bacterium]
MNLPRLAHDIRSPLARARTMVLLLDGATPAEMAEYRELLLDALEDIEQILRPLDNAEDQI